jgi:hypothetical protein
MMRPTFHNATWRDQGHVMRLSDPACPTCRATLALVTADLLERLHLDALPALTPDPVLPVGQDMRQLIEGWR